MNGVEAYRAIMDCWRTAQTDSLAGLFHEHAVYQDPTTSGCVQGVEAIVAYMAESIASLQSVWFEVATELVHDNESATEWVMHSIFGGRDVSLHGTTVIAMRDERVIRQRDYFDPREFTSIRDK